MPAEGSRFDLLRQRKGKEARTESSQDCLSREEKESSPAELGVLSAEFFVNVVLLLSCSEQLCPRTLSL